jgi:hypothetical protein
MLSTFYTLYWSCMITLLLVVCVLCHVTQALRHTSLPAAMNSGDLVFSALFAQLRATFITFSHGLCD